VRRKDLRISILEALLQRVAVCLVTARQANDTVGCAVQLKQRSAMMGLVMQAVDVLRYGATFKTPGGRLGGESDLVWYRPSCGLLVKRHSSRRQRVSHVSNIWLVCSPAAPTGETASPIALPSVFAGHKFVVRHWLVSDGVGAYPR
jgi:hypothetical protein